MSSLDQALTRKALSSGVVRQWGTDGPVAFRLRYIGTGTVTSVTVTTATNIVLVTSDGGTDTYTFATYTTVGAVVDAINADGIFEAKPIDALRSMNVDTNSELLDGAISSSTDEDGLTVWDAKVDTSVALKISVGLTPSFKQGSFLAPKGHRVHLKEIVYSVNMGTAAVDSVQIWKRKGAVETQLVGLLSVDTTETTIRFANGEGMISGGPDEDIIVLVKDAATLADATGNFVRVYGIVE